MAASEAPTQTNHSTLSEPSSKEPLRDAMWRNIATVSMVGVAILVAAFFGFMTDTFMTTGNVLNVLRQMAPTLVVAVAMTFVITTGQIDLSVGSTVAFVSALSAVLLDGGWDSSVVILIALLAGATIGAINGWFSAYQGVPSFIVTLAALSFIRGFALLLTEGFSVPISRDLFFINIGRGQLFGISVPAIISVGVAILGAIVLSRMRFGQYVTGIGSNEESVRRSGVNTKRIKMAVLVISGTSAAIAGMMIAGRLGSGSANSAVAFELTVIAAVVLGGTDLFGGKGTIVGSIVGTFITATVANGLILMGVSPFLTQIVTGIILLLAVWVNIRGFAPLRRRAGN
jgi:simple sugar transport system permease protein